jgi:hypothetical protein
MKRNDLIRTIEGFGCVFVRHGGKHDWYRNPATGVSQPVPTPRNQGVPGPPHHPDVEQPADGRRRDAARGTGLIQTPVHAVE